MMFAIDRLIINALSSKDSVDDQSLIGAHKIKQLFFYRLFISLQNSKLNKTIKARRIDVC